MRKKSASSSSQDRRYPTAETQAESWADFRQRDSDEEGTIFEYWEVLRRHSGALLLFALAGLSLAGALTLVQQPIFRAASSIEVQGINENFMNARDMSPTVSAGGSYLTHEIQTQAKILRSQTLLDRVQKRLPVPDSVQANPVVSQPWRPMSFLLPGSPTYVDAVRRARSSFQARPSDSDRIVEIACESTDPKVAADFVNLASEQFIEESLESRWRTSQRTAEFLSLQLEDLKGKLRGSQDLLQSYARSRNMMFTSNKQNVLHEKLAQVQEELSRAQAERIARQSVYEEAAKQSPEALAQVLNDDRLRSLQSELAKLSGELAEEMATLTEDHPKVQRLQAHVSEMEAALAKAYRGLLARMKTEYESAVRREQLLTNVYSNQADLVNDQGGRAIQYDMLKQEVDTNRQLYDSMLQKVKEAGIAGAMRASNIRVVDKARVPSHPVRPVLWKNLVLGAFGGGFLGMIFVLLRERTDRSLREPGEASNYLHVPELGVIPSASACISARTYPRIFRSRDGHANGNGISNGSGHGNGNGNGNGNHHDLAGQLNGKNGSKSPGECPIELAAWHRQPPVFAEAFRSVLTSVLFLGQHSQHAADAAGSAFVICSANPGEGKSTLTSNIGAAAAQVGRRVLIVDADLHHPRLHRIYQIPNERGFGDLLMESQGDRQPPLPAVEWEIPGLFVMPSGSSGRDVLGLLYSAALPNILLRLRREFDLVLIDTPPILQISDARMLARLSDGVLLVCRAGHTSRDALLDVRRRLKSDGTRILGTVLNDWRPLNSGDHYAGLYYYHAGASRDNKKSTVEV